VPCLVWESPEGRIIHDLDRAVLVIGRDAVSDVVVLEPAVSRRHALVQVNGDAVTVTDLGSSSGTRINGARLTPDLPSTLAPGDIIQLGRVAFTYHVGPPPPVPLQLAPEPPPAPSAPVLTIRKDIKAPARRTASRPARKRPDAGTPASPGGPPWKWIAIGAAFLTVGMAGVLIGLVVQRGGEGTDEPPTASRDLQQPEPSAPESVPTKQAEKEPEPDPDPEPKPDRMLASDGEMPPRGFVSVTDFPDLLELNGETYYPVRIVTWDAARVRAVGTDGRTYSIRQDQVTKAEDRVDLARRAARARQQLDPDDADAQLGLAQWCSRRYIKRATRLLAKRVLELRPGDAEAIELLRTTE